MDKSLILAIFAGVLASATAALLLWVVSKVRRRGHQCEQTLRQLGLYVNPLREVPHTRRMELRASDRQRRKHFGYARACPAA